MGACPSGMLAQWQFNRWRNSTAFESLVSLGSPEALPRVLMVPYIGIYHDSRYQRADVLLYLSDLGLLSGREMLFLKLEVNDAGRGRDIARLAEQ